MMRLWCVLAVILMVDLLSINSVAAEAPKNVKIAKQDGYRLCEAKDLKGAYVLVRLLEQPSGPEQTLYDERPFQYLAFYNETAFSRADSINEIKSPEELNTLLSWPQKMNHRLRYTIDPKEGSLVLYEDDIITYRYRCLYVTQNVDELIQGDLVLTAYTRRKSLVYKIYRHWF